MSVDHIAAVRAAVDTFTAKTSETVDELRSGLRAANDTIDQLNARMDRMAGAANDNAEVGVNASALRAEHKAISAFVRSGDESRLREIHAANSAGNSPEGGYLVMPERASTMIKKLWDSVAMRRLARVEVMESGDRWEEPIDFDEVGATWVGEQSSRPETDSAELKMLTVPLDEIYSLQKVTQRLLDDAAFDVGSWVSGKIDSKFARSENSAFVSGNGVGKPRGLLTYPTSSAADASRSWGTIQTVASGHATQITSDALRTMVWTLRSPYRAGATWLMNSATASSLDKLKDAAGAYIWRESSVAGVPPTLLGYPVEIDETMPDIAASSLSIAFGNFKLAYLIVDRPGSRLLRDPFTSKPHVLFYSYRRVGGALANSEAVKLMQTGA